MHEHMPSAQYISPQVVKIVEELGEKNNFVELAI
jgi:hypothetical protein